ncbi:unnamed protein product [Gulo gulo]|uniref:Uncharacterized protein n=1 Tax=Gulo gulo TaxID=48420 RepID=A0A9X9PUF3_GULGU|nr:unnamed protein product [Gulo gulo]
MAWKLEIHPTVLQSKTSESQTAISWSRSQDQLFQGTHECPSRFPPWCLPSFPGFYRSPNTFLPTQHMLQSEGSPRLFCWP